MKINRWWYSKEQKNISTMLRGSHTCHVFVNDKWYEYTEWTTSVNGKCNWEDAVLIAESETVLPIMVNGVRQSKGE